MNQILLSPTNSLVFQKQLKLLEKSVDTKIPLADVLKDVGWTYEDLIYETSKAKTWTGCHPLDLQEVRPLAQGVPVVSFFTGCGGMDLGLEASGYSHLAAFELNEIFCKTLRRNRPQWNIFGPPTHSGDVSNFEEITETLGQIISTPFEGLFVGGPPCQPFSIAANQRFSRSDENFKRIGFLNETNGNLLFDFLQLIIAFRPRSFVIENVTGLRDIDGGTQLKTMIEELSQNGYRVEEPFVLNAANYGVPQYRSRLFIVGSRSSGVLRHPAPFEEIVGAGSVLGDSLSQLANSETREHKAESILRYMRLGYGQRDQLGRVDRLDPSLPSKTVIAGGTRGGGRSHLHPEVPRTLSVRECALLQTFPKDYVFMGTSARQFTQVGNAVPPVLAAQIGNSIAASYF
ncbi:DNA cytosine methyltransferase [Limnothrix sp. FACHB-708]|uniref:DNA cytosine methyltransferase n=1 Tax=unclassified Limnothrix TaxID=2632864 RepID=UPI001689EB56|nr:MULTISPECIES: DNA cytosine methyltransferase [unclassified Limnothrix]MBD2552964.1 DNA cytosine methyltransferase [Limnothrix sp. FACHB-708]MBD2589224.1 DNA cytosine methyltransferase [Limnothrix sp. FACHB-406]